MGFLLEHSNRCKFCGRFKKNEKIMGGDILILKDNLYYKPCLKCINNPKHHGDLAIAADSFNTRRSGIVYASSK